MFANPCGAAHGLQVDIRLHRSVCVDHALLSANGPSFVRCVTVAFCLHVCLCVCVCVCVCVLWLHQHGFAMGNIEVLLTTPTMSWTLGGVTPVRNQVTIPSAAVAAQIAAGSARVVIRVGGVDAMAGCVALPVSSVGVEVTGATLVCRALMGGC